MNSDQFDDLKQFIAASVSQSEARLRDELRQGEERLKGEMVQLRDELHSEMQTGFAAFRQEMADGFLAIGEAIDDIHKQLEAQRVTTDRRLTKLERRMA